MLLRLVLYCIVSNLPCLECQRDSSDSVSDYYILVKPKYGKVEPHFSANKLFFSEILSNSTSKVIVHFIKMVFVNYIKLETEGDANVTVTGRCLGTTAFQDVVCVGTHDQNVSTHHCNNLCRQLKVEGTIKNILSIDGRDSFMQHLVGCYESNKSRVGVVISNTRSCLDHCQMFKYVGLSLGQCFCEHNLSQYNPIEMSHCVEESGGLRHGHYLIFSQNQTMMSLRIPTPKCAYSVETCKPCPSGRYGLYCDMSNCHINNGHCEDKDCKEDMVFGHRIGICQCKPGYYLAEMLKCSAPDKCIESRCHNESTVCVNKLESYDCKCIPGYERYDLYKCKDIDECQLSTHNCNDQATCENTEGSFICNCPQGQELKEYFWLETECLDKDECMDYNICDSEISFCVNIAPGYECHCIPGYINIDQITCTEAGSITASRHKKVSITTELYSTTLSDEVFNEYYFVVVSAFMVLYASFILVYCTMSIKAKRAKASRSRSSTSARASPESMSMRYQIN